MLAVSFSDDLWEKGAKTILACPADSRIINGASFEQERCAQLSHIPAKIGFYRLAALCMKRCHFDGQFYDDGTIAKLELRSIKGSPATIDAALEAWENVLVEKIEGTKVMIKKIEPKSPKLWRELIELAGLD